MFFHQTGLGGGFEATVSEDTPWSHSNIDDSALRLEKLEEVSGFLLLTVEGSFQVSDLDRLPQRLRGLRAFRRRNLASTIDAHRYLNCRCIRNDSL